MKPSVNLDIIGLIQKCDEIDPNDAGATFTRAGRSSTKHCVRPGRLYPVPKGNKPEINQLAHRIVEEILNDPDLVGRWKSDGRFEVKTPDGRGIDFYPDGTMRGFREP